MIILIKEKLINMMETTHKTNVDVFRADLYHHRICEYEKFCKDNAIVYNQNI